MNGTVVTTLGAKADPERDRVTVDGKPLVFPKQTLLIAFHKPPYVMVTRSDPEGRPTVYDYLPKTYRSLKPVGRLDFDSEGLLLLTSSGDLQHQLLHPRYHLEKRYEVVVSPLPTSEQLEALKRGAGIYHPIKIRMLRPGKGRSHLEMTLSEGKNRQIRTMCAAVGLRVERLTRVAIGPIKLGDLPRGENQALVLSRVMRALGQRP